MGEGRDKHIKECHSFEAVVDTEAGLLVAGQTCQSSTDCSRLAPLVDAASTNEPEGIQSVDADSGFYSGDSVAELINEGIDTCIPDTNTVCDMRRGVPIGTLRSGRQGSIHLEYDKEADCYRCPEGNRLLPGSPVKDYGQIVTPYRAERCCTGCPLADKCLTQPKAKYRTIKRGEHVEILEEARQRFGEGSHQDRYHHRGEAIETVFGFIRGTLGYRRWMVRGADRVACEARLFSMAFQFRKVHLRWSLQHA
jgi:transposase